MNIDYVLARALYGETAEDAIEAGVFEPVGPTLSKHMDMSAQVIGFGLPRFFAEAVVVTMILAVLAAIFG